MSERLYSSPAAVIFDMDGLLLDTETLYRDAIVSSCWELGYSILPETHLSMIGVPTDRVNEILLDSFGPDFPLVRFYGLCSIYVNTRCREGIPIKPGAHDLLKALKAKGVPTAVATSTDRKTTTHHLKNIGFLDLLDTVVTRDDVQHHKPHPETYLAAADRLEVDPVACWALEDSYNGVRSAHAAGMATIMIPDLLQPTEEISSLCVAVMPTLQTVRELVERTLI
ncbi:HAD family hydrolase [Microvirga rosea]|uniref:HAD family hydrolase n=1 Tax=Microvirga rosea TaxID=2715425 RepID=UPI001D0A1DA9|nr:HAD family phosphatase [Microvirga rosea]MCB8823515.1 HAD family phosphatase [Microvirga rosea]